MMRFIFPLATLAFMAVALLYLAHRFAAWFPFFGRLVWFVVFGAIVALGITSLVTLSVSDSHTGQMVYSAAMVALGVLLMLLLGTLAADIVGFVLRFAPSTKGFAALVITAALSIYSLWNASFIHVREVTIQMPHLHHSIRAVLWSDVHLGNFRGREHLARIVELTNELRPDVVFNVGDMFDSRAHFGYGDDVLEPLEKLAAPQIFVYGNHDVYAGKADVIELMRESGATVLTNNITDFGELQVVGLENMPADNLTYDPHATPGQSTIQSALSSMKIARARPTLILHHRPDGLKYMARTGAGALLTGHTHGGQIFPFNLITPLMFEFDKGLHRHDDMAVYVSQGAGTFFAPMRLGTLGEITLIDLVPMQ
jgi:predicted MPP superfamily phosphohydrolase